MSKKNAGEPKGSAGQVIGFRPMTLVVFSVGLVLAGGLIGSGLVRLGGRNETRTPAVSQNFSSNPADRPAPNPVPPWGELRTSDIWVERPAEYVADETGTNGSVAWIFDPQPVAQVKTLLQGCGLASAHIDRLLASGHYIAAPDGLVLKPEDDLIFALDPEVRSKLYRELARKSINNTYWMPFLYQGTNSDDWFSGSELDASVIQTAKKLMYTRGSTHCFSDLHAMMRAIPEEKQRLSFVKAISRQPALLVRLHIRPDTDVPKVLDYWERGAQAKDALPLLESLKRRPEGGSISLLNILPPFARERLFTFPKPPRPGEPGRDCHWSTFNFFNEVPDDHFSDPAYMGKFIDANYYPIAKATRYGDVLMLVQGQSTVLHSAVYLADDILFTKNGNNINQPWTMMRLKDLLAVYEFLPDLRVLYYRHNNW